MNNKMKLIVTLVVLFVIINFGLMVYSFDKHEKLEQEYWESVVQIVTDAPEFDRGQGSNELYIDNKIDCPKGFINCRSLCISENATIYDNKDKYSINPIGQLIPSAHCDVVCEPMLFLEQRTCVGLEICMCDYIDLNSPSTYENCSWAELIPQ